MNDSRVFVDTIVFVYALYQNAKHHVASRKFLESQPPSVTLCVSAQVLSEFYSTVTNPRRVTKAIEAGQAVKEVVSILALPAITVLPITQKTVSFLIELAGRYLMSGSDIYDLQIVATMLSSGVHKVCTFDTGDFGRFREIQVATP